MTCPIINLANELLNTSKILPSFHADTIFRWTTCSDPSKFGFEKKNGKSTGKKFWNGTSYAYFQCHWTQAILRWIDVSSPQRPVYSPLSKQAFACSTRENVCGTVICLWFLLYLVTNLVRGEKLGFHQRVSDRFQSADVFRLWNGRRRRKKWLLLVEFSWGRNAFLLTITCGNPATKSRNASITWSLLLVVLKSLLDFPSLFLIPSIRKPNVAVDEIVSLQTIYLLAKTKRALIISNVFRSAAATRDKNLNYY